MLIDRLLPKVLHTTTNNNLIDIRYLCNLWKGGDFMERHILRAGIKPEQRLLDPDKGGANVPGVRPADQVLGSNDDSVYPKVVDRTRVPDFQFAPPRADRATQEALYDRLSVLRMVGRE